MKERWSDKADFLFGSCRRAMMMYEAHTVQTGSYKFAWRVDWWEGGWGVGGGGGWRLSHWSNAVKEKGIFVAILFSLKLLFVKITTTTPTLILYSPSKHVNSIHYLYLLVLVQGLGDLWEPKTQNDTLKKKMPLVLQKFDNGKNTSEKHSLCFVHS